jgi:hypothetical protein
MKGGGGLATCFFPDISCLEEGEGEGEGGPHMTGSS